MSSRFESIDATRETETRIVFPLDDPEPEAVGHDFPQVYVVDETQSLRTYRPVTSDPKDAA